MLHAPSAFTSLISKFPTVTMGAGHGDDSHHVRVMQSEVAAWAMDNGMEGTSPCTLLYRFDERRGYKNPMSVNYQHFALRQRT